MRYWLFILLGLALVAIGCIPAFVPARLLWVIYPAVGFAAVVMLLLFRSVIKPAHTVQRGLDLIAAQDFNNRLNRVGEREADRIVKLFNTMIDKLRNERLLNMERERFMQLLVEASPMGVVILDFDHHITLVNPSFLKLTGLESEQEVLGLEVGELPSDLARRMAGVPLGESRQIRMGDTKHYRCYHLNFIQSGFQRHFYLIESLTEEVIKAERTVYEKVIRTISHEVNNTMGGVRSVMETLHDLTDSEEIREVIDSCNDRCCQLTHFISSYADVVRVPEPVKMPVELNGMLGEMMLFLKNMHPEEVELEFIPWRDEIKAEIDVMLMQQVLLNIVKNAVESISGTGRIELRAAQRNGRPVIEVNNNGEPISEEVGARLFSPFFTTKRQGRGLGLILVSEILNRHGASYSLRTGQDGITRFTIILPPCSPL